MIITGAIENNLPKEYLDFLSNVKDNGYNGEVEVPLSFHQVSDQKVWLKNELQISIFDKNTVFCIDNKVNKVPTKQNAI